MNYMQLGFRDDKPVKFQRINMAIPRNDRSKSLSYQTHMPTLLSAGTMQKYIYVREKIAHSH
ncbi:predicted protein [Botrytis cinerea T4]|uniref:Uncharacterized protein n=1 Tax=Botryotinia fuckeliana (strain T4) TaxID=999810 RepID=G2XSR5_BOTF4|nr:predicted protein [Botrytis cinerea T4]